MCGTSSTIGESPNEEPGAISAPTPTTMAAMRPPAFRSISIGLGIQRDDDRAGRDACLFELFRSQVGHMLLFLLRWGAGIGEVHHGPCRYRGAVDEDVAAGEIGRASCRERV